MIERLRARFRLLWTGRSRWREASPEEEGIIEEAQEGMDRREFFTAFPIALAKKGLAGAAIVFGTKYVIEKTTHELDVSKTPEIFDVLIKKFGLSKDPDPEGSLIKRENYILPPKVVVKENVGRGEANILGYVSNDPDRAVYLEKGEVDSAHLAHEMGHTIYERYVLYYLDKFIVEKAGACGRKKIENIPKSAYTEHRSFPGFKSMRVLTIGRREDIYDHCLDKTSKEVLKVHRGTSHVSGKKIIEPGVKGAYNEFIGFAAEFLMYPKDFFSLRSILLALAPEKELKWEKRHRIGYGMLVHALNTYGAENTGRIVGQMIRKWEEYEPNIPTLGIGRHVVDQAAEELRLDKGDYRSEFGRFLSNANADAITIIPGISVAMLFTVMEYLLNKEIDRKEALKLLGTLAGVTFITYETMRVL